MTLKEERYELMYLYEMLDGNEEFDGVKELKDQTLALLKELKGVKNMNKLEREEFRARLEKQIKGLMHDFDGIYDTLPQSEFFQ